MEWDTAAAHAVISEANCSLIKYTKNNIKEKLVYNKENLLNDWFIVESVT
jgi:3'(2'), 5'-bisphosphate nucleotidase